MLLNRGLQEKGINEANSKKCMLLADFKIENI